MLSTWTRSHGQSRTGTACKCSVCLSSSTPLCVAWQTVNELACGESGIVHGAECIAVRTPRGSTSGQYFLSSSGWEESRWTTAQASSLTLNW